MALQFRTWRGRGGGMSSWLRVDLSLADSQRRTVSFWLSWASSSHGHQLPEDEGFGGLTGVQGGHFFLKKVDIVIYAFLISTLISKDRVLYLVN
ncbi:uncharacterized protein [Physcomitrium patens]|uniref:uncharacterized protein isoform X2 n=1 Tax=Physcomitrium patens TaxID=3218 RepID=UPI003CCDC3FE